MTTKTTPTCQKRVHSDSRDFTGHLCTFTVVGQEEGANWCSRHLPSARKAKNAIRNAAWDAKWAAERAEAEAKQRQQAEDCRKLAAYPTLVAACRAALDRLSAWSDGNKHAQIAAEVRQDRHAAEGFYNTVQNYTALMDRLRDALAAAGEST